MRRLRPDADGDGDGAREALRAWTGHPPRLGPRVTTTSPLGVSHSGPHPLALAAPPSVGLVPAGLGALGAHGAPAADLADGPGAGAPLGKPRQPRVLLAQCVGVPRRPDAQQRR